MKKIILIILLSTLIITGCSKGNVNQIENSSIGNFPTSDMLAQKGFDYTEYIQHKDEPSSIEKINNSVANSVKQGLTDYFENIKMDQENNN